MPATKTKPLSLFHVEGSAPTLNDRAFAASPPQSLACSLPSRRTARFLILLLLFFVSGCTSGRRVTLPDWQESVVGYVNDEGEGSLSVLRNITLRGGRRGFAVLGHPVPARAQDVVGLLLAHRPVLGRPTFIYLVAQVVRQQVRDVRLALLSEQDGKLRWQLGPENDDALRTYLAWRRDRWQSLYPDRDDPPLSYQDFPLEEDAFDVSVGEHEISAEHSASGARWTVAVPATQPAAIARTPE